MRIRTRVAVAVATLVLAVVAIASVTTDDGDRARQSYRTSVEVDATCRSPRIVVADRAWDTATVAPADWMGLVHGTLWISGADAVFVADDGTSMRYSLLDQASVPPPPCTG